MIILIVLGVLIAIGLLIWGCTAGNEQRNDEIIWHTLRLERFKEDAFSDMERTSSDFLDSVKDIFRR